MPERSADPALQQLEEELAAQRGQVVSQIQGPLKADGTLADEMAVRMTEAERQSPGALWEGDFDFIQGKPRILPKSRSLVMSRRQDKVASLYAKLDPHHSGVVDFAQLEELFEDLTEAEWSMACLCREEIRAERLYQRALEKEQEREKGGGAASSSDQDDTQTEVDLSVEKSTLIALMEELMAGGLGDRIVGEFLSAADESLHPFPLSLSSVAAQFKSSAVRLYGMCVDRFIYLMVGIFSTCRYRSGRAPAFDVSTSQFPHQPEVTEKSRELDLDRRVRNEKLRRALGPEAPPYAFRSTHYHLHAHIFDSRHFSGKGAHPDVSQHNIWSDNPPVKNNVTASGKQAGGAKADMEAKSTKSLPPGQASKEVAGKQKQKIAGGGEKGDPYGNRRWTVNVKNFLNDSRQVCDIRLEEERTKYSPMRLRSNLDRGLDKERIQTKHLQERHRQVHEEIKEAKDRESAIGRIRAKPEATKTFAMTQQADPHLTTAALLGLDKQERKRLKEELQSRQLAACSFHPEVSSSVPRAARSRLLKQELRERIKDWDDERADHLVRGAQSIRASRERQKSMPCLRGGKSFGPILTKEQAEKEENHRECIFQPNIERLLHRAEKEHEGAGGEGDSELSELSTVDSNGQGKPLWPWEQPGKQPRYRGPTRYMEDLHTDYLPPRSGGFKWSENLRGGYRAMHEMEFNRGDSFYGDDEKAYRYQSRDWGRYIRIAPRGIRIRGILDGGDDQEDDEEDEGWRDHLGDEGGRERTSGAPKPMPSSTARPSSVMLPHSEFPSHNDPQPKRSIVPFGDDQENETTAFGKIRPVSKSVSYADASGGAFAPPPRPSAADSQADAKLSVKALMKNMAGHLPR
uniref:Uncharacterized protein n=1 Tax=Chromera velia CCMP2878 TaxID=1169474 RepID=A0A0G4G7R0_9ALVE|eukprot:Cvel_20662.t1-p1 / transcript=Cvel_20662.t1 / gene=Cvel_20662 / organism=Chromera_velia_CCMP2878 / gene_product=hypothetical protein / transcript_product=hypothetical protein / location=Cvel_scaffold1875:23164-29217(-) / protein_length=857 / sequence_SO=supercontig / SO=protein_coding / is_pseudo=false